MASKVLSIHVTIPPDLHEALFEYVLSSWLSITAGSMSTHQAPSKSLQYSPKLKMITVPTWVGLGAIEYKSVAQAEFLTSNIGLEQIIHCLPGAHRGYSDTNSELSLGYIVWFALCCRQFKSLFSR